MAELSLKIFTLNCWGIPLVSKNRFERIKAIAEYLAQGNHNVACLQELWSENDFLLIKYRVKSVLPYSHYFYSGVAGSGLAVFSEWRIEDVFFHQWSLNGYIHKIQHGDWFGGKGVGVCRLRSPYFSLIVYCAHLVAEYGTGSEYEAHRIVQALSLAELLRVTGGADVSVLAGDLNTERHQLPYRLIEEVGGFSDSLTEQQALPTCQQPGNSYTCLQDGPPLRIDHVLYRTKPQIEVEVMSATQPLGARVPGANFSYSDHDAVSVHFRVSRRASPLDRAPHVPAPAAALGEARAVCTRALTEARHTRLAHTVVGAASFLLLFAGVPYDPIRFAAAALALYCIVMATLWYRMELNALRACISTVDNRLLADSEIPLVRPLEYCCGCDLYPRPFQVQYRTH